MCFYTRSIIWLKSTQGNSLGHLDGWWVNPGSVLKQVRLVNVSSLSGESAAWLAKVGALRRILFRACRIEVPPVEPASDQISTPKVSDNGLDQTSNLEVLNGGFDRAVILFNGLSELSFNGLRNVVLDLEDPCSTEAVDVPSLLAPQVNAFNQKDLQDIALNSEMAVDPLPVGLSDPKTLQLVYFIYLRLEWAFGDMVVDKC
ncbi:hypothetical protein V6N11_031460 [Hibiscus sabdariffa]|uniref:Uncharacterized protein n=1 Tax=Hibiscus sabdariffa TaxID=183260 RepID=A0ABR2SYJ3_9ROSI